MTFKHIVRSTGSGVWYGQIIREEATPAGYIVQMRNARRLYRWGGAAELSEVATYGKLDPGFTRLCTPTDVKVIGVHEVQEVTPEAEARLDALPAWVINKES